METYLSWSGGKDSTASIILCHEHGIHIDGIITAEIMFSHKENISGELPCHIEWMYNVAIPRIENEFGYKVTVVRDSRDFLDLFNKRILKSKHKDRIGKKVGFPISGRCIVLRELKLTPIKKFFKDKKCIQIVGIGAEETERLKSLPKNRRSVLAEFGYTTSMARKLCEKYNLLSPSYRYTTRGGNCWFCPNCNVEFFAKLKHNQPQLWGRLKELAKDPETVTDKLGWGRPFKQLEEKVDKCPLYRQKWLIKRPDLE